MRKYDPDQPLISIHIPKTAGISLRKVLQNWFKDKLLLHYFNEKENKLPAKYKLEPGICIHGHFNAQRGFGVSDYYKKAEQFITFFREPLELQLSNYFFIKKNIRNAVSFRNGEVHNLPWSNVDEFLNNSNSYILKHIPFSLTIDNYEDMINKYFIAIGIVEKMQESVGILAEKLGKNKFPLNHINSSPRDEKPGKKAIQYWIERHELEYRIYEYVKNFFQ